MHLKWRSSNPRSRSLVQESQPLQTVTLDDSDDDEFFDADNELDLDT